MTQVSKMYIVDSKRYLGNQEKKVALPKNAIFDKGRVGCGGTTLALDSDIPYIICVPFVSLIENKVQQYASKGIEVYGFHGDNNLKRDLIAYLNRVDCPKIMVTYNSLEKLTKWITPSKYNLLVDELHLLFTEYSYRNESVQGVLRSYTKYAEFCFMTATPLEPEFMIDELQHLPVVEAIWEDIKNVKVESIRCKGNITVKDTVSQIIREFLTSGRTENAYFFVNSVSYIADLIEDCELDDTNTRVIYSKNNKTELTIKRGNILDTPKKINFITSTAFEGSDFYDENGLTFIISDSSETHTLIDISTKFIQIAGRIRNSKYSDKIYHIYKSTRYSEVSYEEFKNITEETIKDTKEMIADISGKSYASKISVNSLYVRKEGNVFTFDPNMVKIDLYNFKICRNIYSLRVNLNREYERYNFEVKHLDATTSTMMEEVMKENIDKVSFQDIVEAVRNETEKYKFAINYPIRDLAFKKYPFLQEAITKIGFEGIEDCNYIITNIKAKLINKLDKSEENKIILALKNRLQFNNGDFIKTSDLKVKFNEVYSDLGITKKAKGSDITSYYEVKETVKKINGKSEKGYIIIRSKIIF
jgi:hypothetical protein